MRCHYAYKQGLTKVFLLNTSTFLDCYIKFLLLECRKKDDTMPLCVEQPRSFSGAPSLFWLFCSFWSCHICMLYVLLHHLC